LLVELLEDAPSHLASCLVELICNCAELPAAKRVRPKKIWLVIVCACMPAFCNCSAFSHRHV